MEALAQLGCCYKRSEKERPSRRFKRHTASERAQEDSEEIVYASAQEEKVEIARRRINQSQKKLEAADAAVAKVQKMLDETKQAADKAKDDASKTMGDVPGVLLLELTPWNDHYRMLVGFKE